MVVSLEANRRALLPIVEQTDAADRGGGEDGEAGAVFAFGLVVEADVAAHDGEIERSAGLGNAFDTADELAHDLRPLRVAEVEAIGDRERLRPDRAEVAIGFSDSLLPASDRVGVAIAGRAVGGERKRFFGAVH